MTAPDLQAIEKVDAILQQSPQLTLNDAAAATGLPVNETRHIMLALVQRYYCKVQVTEHGDLLYDFGQLQRRNQKTWEERKAALKKWLWQAFQFLFKLWITLTLIVYFVIFLLILIALIVAISMAKNNDNKERGDDTLQDLFRTLGNMIELLLYWKFYQDTIYYEKDEYGQTYKHYKPASDLQPQEKSFIVAVYDFVFGPPRVEPEPEAHFKEIAAFCRRNQGIIALHEIKALTGCNTEQAEKLMADAVVRFNGSIELSPEGILYADLYELTRSQDTSQDAPIIWFWDEYEPAYEYTGNTTPKNAIIVFLNAFNWAFSSFFLFGVNSEDTLIWVMLGIVPFTFSALFFAIPVLRYFYLQPLIRQRNINNIRKRIWKVFFLQQAAIVMAKDLEKAAMDTPSGQKPFSTATLKHILQQEMYDWNAQPHFSEQGTTDYDFSTLRYWQNVMQTLRKQRQKNNNDLGNVLYEVGNL